MRMWLPTYCDLSDDICLAHDHDHGGVPDNISESDCHCDDLSGTTDHDYGAVAAIISASTTQALTDDKWRKKRELSKDDTCKSR